MAEISILEALKVPVEEIQRKLDERQSYNLVGAEYGVSGRTVYRYVKPYLVRRYCWKRIDTIDTHAKQEG